MKGLWPMKKIDQKKAGWLTLLFLFLGTAFSIAAMFRGNIYWLMASAICLGFGLYCLKQYFSGQNFS